MGIPEECSGHTHPFPSARARFPLEKDRSKGDLRDSNRGGFPPARTGRKECASRAPPVGRVMGSDPCPRAGGLACLLETPPARTMVHDPAAHTCSSAMAGGTQWGLPFPAPCLVTGNETPYYILHTYVTCTYIRRIQAPPVFALDTTHRVHSRSPH